MRLGVLGWPVAHSRSPAMHTAALAACGLTDWSYQRLPVPPDLFEETVRALGGAGFAGANVTVPHKQAALTLSSSATPAAREIGAANTLSFSADGGIEADNTDAPALLDALGFDPRGASAMVLGAGGSARAVIWALVGSGAEVAIWNRTHQRAEHVASELGGRAVSSGVAADILVNCTTVGMDVCSTSSVEEFADLPIHPHGLGDYRCVVDLVYGQKPTPLLAAAASAGATTVDGLEFLVRQGARSFESWTGHPAPLEVMRAAAAAG